MKLTNLVLGFGIVFGAAWASMGASQAVQDGASANCHRLAELSPAKLAAVAKANGLTVQTLKQECYLWTHREQFTGSTHATLQACRYYKSMSTAQLERLARLAHSSAAEIRAACAELAATPSRGSSHHAPSHDGGSSFNPFQCLNDASCGLFQACIHTGLGSQCMDTNNCKRPEESCSVQSDCCSQNCMNGKCE